MTILPVSGQGVSSQQTQPTIFNPTSNLVDAFGNNPLLAGATVRYGQKILGEVVDDKIGKYTTGVGSQIKCYFAVDTRYVIKKILLLLFPFVHAVSNSDINFLYNFALKTKFKK